MAIRDNCKEEKIVISKSKQTQTIAAAKLQRACFTMSPSPQRLLCRGVCERAYKNLPTMAPRRSLLNLKSGVLRHTFGWSRNAQDEQFRITKRVKKLGFKNQSKRRGSFCETVLENLDFTMYEFDP